jgi:DNA (cytosine-5)-methyltransferase 1
MLSFVGIAAKMRPRWIVWENVPGVLSSNSGRDFGTLLGALGQLGYGFAYRILDAQFFGVAQRRRRVFVVGYFGDWRPAAAVLFEPESLRWNIQARAKAPKEIAKTLTRGTCQRFSYETEDFIVSSYGVRRLTPVECERLQGFPDNFTNIPWRGKSESPDSLRYSALGNSMAVPVMAWLGKRIDYVQNLIL